MPSPGPQLRRPAESGRAAELLAEDVIDELDALSGAGALTARQRVTLQRHVRLRCREFLGNLVS